MTGDAVTGGRVLLVGARGMLGCELAERLARRADAGAITQLTCWDIPDLDIRDPAAVRSAVATLRPSVLINTAAFTDVDGCESKPAEAMAVNGDAPGYLAAACREIDALLVHVSTDFVFDGAAQRPYRPGDPAYPLSLYGRSKLAGEQAIIAAGGAHLIVRTSWMFGPHGRNFVEAILGRAEKGENLRVVDDQVGRPTHAGDLADALLRLVDRDARGVYHFANAGQCSWHAFAERIVELAGCDVEVAAITSEELHRPAKRPAYSVLDTTDYERLTGQAPAPWTDALKRYLHARSAVRAAG